MRAPLPDKDTQRLYLRRFEVGDDAALAPVFAKPEAWMYFYGQGLTQDETATFVIAQVEEWSRCGFGLWVAIEKASGRVVGYVGVSVLRFLPDIPPAKLVIAVLLLGGRAWLWRSRGVPVPCCVLPFQRKDHTIKPWDQTAMIC